MLLAILMGTALAGWEDNPAYAPSLDMEPESRSVILDSAKSERLRLGIKRYRREGAPPVLLIPGLASNDRVWDSRVARHSAARFLHAHGFDVWIGNLRGTGTPGFASEVPKFPHHWSVDDLAAEDIPALVGSVVEETGRWPLLLGHSMGAWVNEGYLGGLRLDREGIPIADRELAVLRQSKHPGVVSVGGVHDIGWPHSVDRAEDDPIRDEESYYQSNYELELLAKIGPLYPIVRNLPTVPMGWVAWLLELPLEQVPWIGDRLEKLYVGFQRELAASPFLSMLFYSPNVDPEIVRLHGLDGIEEFPPRILEQLANALNGHGTAQYFKGKPEKGTFRYASARRDFRIPALFVAGTRDRLANSVAIREKGFEQTASRDKRLIEVRAGHLDVLAGKNAPAEVLSPMAAWLRKRAPAE